MLTHKKTRRRENQDTRRKEILNAAIELAVKLGYQQITRELVANKAKTSIALVTWYFDNMSNLKSEIMKAAISRENLPLIAQGLSLGDSHAQSINKELRNKVIEYLSTR